MAAAIRERTSCPFRRVPTAPNGSRLRLLGDTGCVTERLATIAPDVVEQLTSLAASEQRRVALALAREAARRTGVDAVASDSSEHLANRLDEAAWATQERHEVGEATEREYLDAFERARAAWALNFAVEPDPQAALLEAAYETQAALGSVAELRKLLKSLVP